MADLSSACFVLLMCCSLSVAIMDSDDMLQFMHQRLVRVELTQAGLEAKVKNGIPSSVQNELRKQLPEMLKSAVRNVLESEDIQSMLSEMVAAKLTGQERIMGKISSLADENKIRLDSLEKEVRYLKEPVSGSHNSTSSTAIPETGNHLNKTSTKKPGDGLPGSSSSTAMPETSNHSNNTSTKTPADGGYANVSSTTSTPGPTIETSTNWNNNTLVAAAEAKKMRRLLVLPWNHKPPVQIDLSQLSSDVYPLAVDGYNAGIFIPKLNLLVTSVFNPSNASVYLSVLNSRNRTRLLPSVRAFGLAFDDRKDKLILSSSLPIKGIWETDLDGKNQNIIVDYLQKGMFFPHSVVYDSVGGKIYACTQKKLISMKRDGSWLTTLIRGRDIRAVTIDSVGRWLYFNNGYNMYKRSLTTGYTSVVVNHGYLPWDYVYHEENGRQFLFVSSFRQMTVDRIELNNRNRRVRLVSKCSRCNFVTALALLP